MWNFLHVCETFQSVAIDGHDFQDILPLNLLDLHICDPFGKRSDSIMLYKSRYCLACLESLKLILGPVAGFYVVGRNSTVSNILYNIRKNVDLEQIIDVVTTISANSSNTETILEKMDQLCTPTSSDLRSQIWRET